jgi:sodium-dependent dicarboxylate transporter 2/3/5
MGCSCAFMMPAATGPNAIAFGTGRVSIADMVKAGVVANGLAWVLIVVGAWVSFSWRV